MLHSAWKIVTASLLFAGATKGQTLNENDLAAHSSPGDCWTVVDGKVYDVTSYAGSHPGGSGLVHGMCGADASSNFNGEHGGTGYMDSFTTFKGTFQGNAPAAPPSEEGGGICFSALASVQVQGKGQVSMKNLQVGDKVLTGALKFEHVYAFGHLHHSKAATFLQIYTDDNKVPLEMSAAHMVFVSGKKNPVRADSIEVGDVLQSAINHGSLVKKISSVTRKGLYAPLTPDGTLMVDGIKTSSYIAIQGHPANEYVEMQHGFKPMSQHDGIHLFLAPFRMICTAFAADFCHDYNEHGMPHYVHDGIQFLKWLDGLDMNIVLQVALFTGALIIFGFLMMVEVSIGTMYVYGTTMAIFSLASALFFKAFGVKVSTSNQKMV